MNVDTRTVFDQAREVVDDGRAEAAVTVLTATGWAPDTAKKTVLDVLAAVLVADALTHSLTALEGAPS